MKRQNKAVFEPCTNPEQIAKTAPSALLFPLSHKVEIYTIYTLSIIYYQGRKHAPIKPFRTNRQASFWHHLAHVRIVPSPTLYPQLENSKKDRKRQKPRNKNP